MSHHMPSPIDLDAPEMEADGLGWTFGVMLVAALFLLFANAGSLRDWIDDQPPGPVQAQAAALADQWVEVTEAMGIGLPRQALRNQWKRAEGARFDGAVENSGTGEGPG